MTAAEIRDRLAELHQHLVGSRPTNIGFPGATDLDTSELWPLFGHLLNNIGDPYAPTLYPANTRAFEREAVDWCADLFRAPADDRWGYVTTGGTEGNEYGLLLARELHPDGVVYYSSAAHYSVPKLADRLRMPSIMVRADRDGTISYGDLTAAVHSHRDRPAIVVATIGTTMTEAVDDVATIRQVLADVPVRRAHIHADAALSGVPLGLLDGPDRPRFDMADGADSLSLSGHKTLGAPFPCGVVLARKSAKDKISSAVDYVGTVDTTICGSRSGHAPLVLWYAVNTYGTWGLRARAAAAREMARYAVQRLALAGVDAWRHPQAMTVVIDESLPLAVRQRWSLATSGPRSHIITVPGVGREQVDAFADDVAAWAATPVLHDAPPAVREVVAA